MNDIKNIILNNINNLIILKNTNGEVVFNNKPYDDFEETIKNGKKGELYLNSQNAWFNITNKSLSDKYTMIIIEDITKYKKREKLLMQQCISDKLTGLYNRQGIDVNLSNFVEEFEQTNTPFTIVIGDIDNFKHINDTYGHPAGDKVLKNISAIIKKQIRKDDFVGRHGGEEFLIILKSDDIPQITQRIEQIRLAIENNIFKYKGTTIKLTMTFGIQLYDGSKDLDTVIDEADKAMYYGKQHGRNQINNFEEIKNTKKRGK